MVTASFASSAASASSGSTGRDAPVVSVARSCAARVHATDPPTVHQFGASASPAQPRALLAVAQQGGHAEQRRHDVWLDEATTDVRAGLGVDVADLMRDEATAHALRGPCVSSLQGGATGRRRGRSLWGSRGRARGCAR